MGKGSARPRYDNLGHLVVESMDQWSFPIGHSTRAVMIVTLIWPYHTHPCGVSTMIKQYWWPYLVLKYEKSYFMSDCVLPCVEIE